MRGVLLSNVINHQRDIFKCARVWAYSHIWIIIYVRSIRARKICPQNWKWTLCAVYICTTTRDAPVAYWHRIFIYLDIFVHMNVYRKKAILSLIKRELQANFQQAVCTSRRVVVASYGGRPTKLCMYNVHNTYIVE